jgi:ubiquinol-cytochrome c reductase cytochrome c1 subunit
MVKHWLLIATALLPCGFALGQEGGEIQVQRAHTDIRDMESLRRGAHDFMKYCSGCHSIAYLRYNRMGTDLNIPEKELSANLMFTSQKPFDGIVSAMPADAADWFGKQPPDLSLMAREKGPDYIYSFLKGFYVDDTRPWGVNNVYLPGTGMPDVVASVQGLQRPVYKNEKDAGGSDHMVLQGVDALSKGSLSPVEYDGFARDIANFLDYAGEPVKAKRQSLGVFVTLFLLVGFVLAYLLKKEYWKDVH